MDHPAPERTPAADPRDRRIRRTWWFLAGSFFVLGFLTIIRLLAGSPRTIDWVLAGLVVIAGLAVVLNRGEVETREAGRRAETETFARILQGLSRSVSPDAIVDAIVEELTVGAAADHTVVVRLRPDARVLEATLVSRRAGVPDSTTILPVSDLEDPLREPAASIRRRVGLQIDPGEPSTVLHDLVAVAAAATRRAVPTLDAAGAFAVDGGSTAFSTAPASPVPPASRAASAASTAPTSSARRSLAALPDRRGSGPNRRQAFAVPDGRRGERRRRDWPILGVVAAVRAVAGSVDLPVDMAGGSRAAGPSERVADRLAVKVSEIYGLKHTIAAPLVTSSGVVGAIVLSRRTAEPWAPAAGRILAGAASEASAALDRAYSHRAAEARASTDALTGLPNRRYFDEFCGLLARRRRADDALGVLMIDIDHFKRLNDTFGHATGDVVLRAVAGAVAGAVREDDVPARYGGEEFAVLLRNPTPTIALEVGERVRNAVAGLDLRSIGAVKVSVSVGVAISRTEDQPIGDLIEQADRALYSAKRGGRDGVVAA